MLIAILLAAVMSGAGLLATNDPPILPTAGLGLLATLSTLDRPLADGVRSLGLASAAIAVLIVLAAAFLESADL